MFVCLTDSLFPVSILYKCIAGRDRPVRVADGPITACYTFIKNAIWIVCIFNTDSKAVCMAMSCTMLKSK